MDTRDSHNRKRKDGRQGKKKQNTQKKRLAQQRKNAQRKRKYIRVLSLQLFILLLLICGFVYLAFGNPFKKNPEDKQLGQSTADKDSDKETQEIVDIGQLIDEAVQESQNLALGYYYQEAIDKLQEFEEKNGSHEKITGAIEQYQKKIEESAPFGAYKKVEEVHHIFFHSLIADTSKAFDGDHKESGYNYYMTTISEFIEMMKQMYEDDYVLVSIHDLVKAVEQEDGSIKMEPGDLMLPPEKKPFVLSQDDVNYYGYMTGDGFASRAVIDENGRPSTEMILEDGSTVVGDYDMVPVLETFLRDHPDFSYKGARGILALTGYEGTLGYRTNNPSSPTYEEDKEAVKEVIKVLKEWGWEFGSHSYGHRDMDKYGYNFLKEDTNRWLEEVGSLVGPTDIYIFPYGIDIEDHEPYSGDKYQYLKDSGFLYYCGVFKSPWMQRRDDYVRMTRRPLDGQAMLDFPERLEDLFDLDKVIDLARPPLQ